MRWEAGPSSPRGHGRGLQGSAPPTQPLRRPQDADHRRAYAGPHERGRGSSGEAEAVAGLRHANILQVHDVGDHEGVAVLHDGAARGGQPGPRPWRASPQACPPGGRDLATLAEAVLVAHRCGIIHRDVKPENILLTTADGTPKIADFGLAAALRRRAGPDRERHFGWGLPAIWHLSSLLGRRERSGQPRTSTRSVSCSTRCSPEDRRSEARLLRRRSGRRSMTSPSPPRD